MHLNYISVSVVITVFNSLSSCFNYDVHNQIGFMAEQHLTPDAQWMVEQLLEDQYRGSIGRAASWADSVSTMQFANAMASVLRFV